MDGRRAAGYTCAVTSAAPTYPGVHDDGRGSGPRDVVVRPAPTCLEIRAPQGRVLTSWPYGDVTLRDNPDPGTAIRLGHRRKPDAELRVFDPALVDILRRHRRAAAEGTLLDPEAAPAAKPARVRRAKTPRPHRTLPPVLRRRLKLAGAAAALVVLGVALYALVAATAPLVARQMADDLPDPWRTAWGSALTTHAGPVCDLAAGREALETLAGRLEAVADLSVALAVTVVDDPAVEGRALPGGHILLTRGLITLLRTPDELAGVLAHAVADAALLTPERTILGHLRLPGLVSVLRHGPAAPPVLLSAALARAEPSPASLRPVDLRALELLEAAGLRRRGLAAFHDVLASRAAVEPLPPLYLRAHPVDRARIQRLRDVSAGGAQALGAARWRAVKRICGTPEPEAEPVGITG